MARYRQKSAEDLRWNKIRRRLTRELDTQVQDWREESLNTLLWAAWDKYNKALETGKKLSIESDYQEWVTRALSDIVGIEIDPPEIDLLEKSEDDALED